MAISQEEKQTLLNIAIKIARDYARGGSCVFAPSAILESSYEMLKKLDEDVKGA